MMRNGRHVFTIKFWLARLLLSLGPVTGYQQNHKRPVYVTQGSWGRGGGQSYLLFSIAIIAII
jgi:hypothetical protein